MTANHASELLLRQLSDGRFHSGEQLADFLGVSRTAVWKHIRRLQNDFDLAVTAVRGRGYRLGAPLELLDVTAIRAELSTRAIAALDMLSVLPSVQSTNGCAIADPPLESGVARVWLAEYQTAGRGRRGRDWVSSFGANIYLSLAWRFDLPMSELQGLSLASGVVVAEVLKDIGCDTHGLKWPNDVLVDGRKLGGILVEVAGEAGGPATAVIGVGLNLRLPAGVGQKIAQPWTDLRSQMSGPVQRNRLVGKLVEQLIHACRLFGAQRLSPFLSRWERFDLLCGEPVCLYRGSEVIEGVYRGIGASGAMILEDQHGCREHHAGEVSLRRKAV